MISFEDAWRMSWSWSERLIDRAADDPLVPAVAVVAALLVLLLSRSLLQFLSAIVLGCVAISVAFDDGDRVAGNARLAAILAAALLAGLASGLIRWRLRRARSALSTTEREREKLRALYEGEVRWRKAAGDRRERLPAAEISQGPAG